MDSLSVTITDRALVEALAKLEKVFSPVGQRAIFEEWARRVKSLVRIPYPAHTYAPLPRIYDWGDGSGLHKFKSYAAQRGFFAAMREGRINVPYQRSGKLAQALNFELSISGGRAVLTVQVDNIGKFKPEWVLGTEAQQSLYFRQYTNWEPLEDTISQPPLFDEIEIAGQLALESIIEDLRL